MSRDNESGFSLIEALIGAGIASIGALAVAAMMQQQLAAQQYLIKKYEITDLQTSIKTFFLNKATCDANMGSAGAITPTTGTTKFHADFTGPLRSGADADDPIIVPTAGLVPGSQTGLNVANMKLEDLAPITVGSTTYQGYLSVAFEHNGKGTPIRPLRLPIKVVVNNAVTPTAINECVTDAPLTAEDMCVSMGGVMVDGVCHVASGYANGCTSTTPPSIMGCYYKVFDPSVGLRNPVAGETSFAYATCGSVATCGSTYTTHQCISGSWSELVNIAAPSCVIDVAPDGGPGGE